MNSRYERSESEVEMERVPYVYLSVDEIQNIPPCPANHYLVLVVSCGRFRASFRELACEDVKVPVCSLDQSICIRIESRHESMWVHMWDSAYKNITKVVSNGGGQCDVDLQLEIPLSVVDPLTGPKFQQSYFALSPSTVIKRSRATQIRHYNNALAQGKSSSSIPKIHVSIEANPPPNIAKPVNTEPHETRTVKKGRNGRGVWRAVNCPKTGKEYWYNTETRKVQWEKPEEEDKCGVRSPYCAQPHDRIDLEVYRYIQKCPILNEVNIQRVKLGVYNIEGRVVNINLRPWGKDEMGKAPILVVSDGPLRQPFMDYVQGSSKNEEWEGIETPEAVNLLPHAARLTFKNTPPPTQKPPDRLQAMRTAKKEAFLRQEAAVKKLGGPKKPAARNDYFNKGTASWESTRPSTPKEPEISPQLDRFKHPTAPGVPSWATSNKENCWASSDSASPHIPSMHANLNRLKNNNSNLSMASHTSYSTALNSVTAQNSKEFESFSNEGSFTHPQATGCFPSIYTSASANAQVAPLYAAQRKQSWDAFPSHYETLPQAAHAGSFTTPQSSFFGNSWLTPNGSYVPPLQNSNYNLYNNYSSYSTVY